MSKTEDQNVANELLGYMQDGFLVLTINRPDSYNSWTTELRAELTRRLKAADEDASVAGVILTGAGENAFCAGQDLKEFGRFEDGEYLETFLNHLFACYDGVRGFGKPLVAAVNGVAAGSGFQLTQFCDLVVAHPDVRMGQTEVNSGLPSVFGTWLMWERVGRRAAELALQGRLMKADEALQLGFVNQIVDADQVMHEAILAAQRLAQQPQVAYRMSKEAIRSIDEDRYAKAMDMAMIAYREAFDTGAPQAEIERFFERRAKKQSPAAAH